MSETRKSLYSGLGVVVAALSVAFGISARDYLERSRSNAAYSGNLVASNERDVPEGDYFYDMLRLLKREYVEPIKDDRKLAIGAVRGMVNSLADARSLFMDPKEYAAYTQAREHGIYEGIGVELAFTYDSERKPTQEELLDPEAKLADTTYRIPRLEVAAVAPGGFADRAGVKVGDWVDSVDGYWVINAELLKRFAEVQRDVTKGKRPASDLTPLRQELRQKADKSLSALKARDRLMLGKSGAVDVIWHRGTQIRETKLEKGTANMWQSTSQSFYLAFVKGAEDKLRQEMLGKSALTIDLRNNALGELAPMEACLKAVAPAGSYGSLASFKQDSDRPLSVEKGNSSPPKLTLLVDRSTRGVAEIFATALSSKGLAKLEGGPMGGDPFIVDHFRLPDGSGYTLASAEYLKPGSDKKLALGKQPYKRDIYGRVAVVREDDPTTEVAMNGKNRRVKA